MERNLLIFGANGFLGKGVIEILLKKNYNEIFLFGSKFDKKYDGSNIHIIETKDLSIENNVISAFSNIKINKNSRYFMFSAIGGYFGGKTVWETDELDFDLMINKNFKSNFLIVKNFSEIIKNTLGGSICLTSAYTASNPEALKFAYGASKSALNYLVKVLSAEGEPINLSINAIAPFIIDTPANREWMSNANYEKWIKAEEIGELVNSLFENFNFISGNIIELKHRFNK